MTPLRYMLASIGCGAALLSACSQPKPAPPPKPVVRVVHDTVTVTSRDPDQDKRIARLELQLYSRDAQLEDMQLRLDETRAEVVRAMAKLRTVASRAQAASAMAEAEIALQSLKSGNDEPAPAGQVARLVRQASSEFDKQNYGCALYLANQAKTAASSYRLSAGNRDDARPGETSFAVPIKLKMTTRGNVRGGPGTNFPIAFAAEPGTEFTAYSYADEWIRISDDGGRTGWVFRSLVARP